MDSHIGSFLFEDRISDDWTERRNSYDVGTGSSGCGDRDDIPPALPSLLRDVQSRYHDTSNDHHHPHRRILLEGPQVMTSSLLFDLAISLASNAPCRCRVSDGNDPTECEHCIAVTVIRSVTLRDDSNRSFPIMCHPRPHAPTVSTGEIENDTMRTPSVSSKKRRLEHFDLDNPRLQRAFRRIQILYVNSIQDILQYLLTIASQPLRRQPWSGILMDQLDDIWMPSLQQEYRDDIATTTIRMSQTVAILVDTISFMEKTHRCSPTIVMSIRSDNNTGSDSLYSTSHIFQRCSTFWSPLHLTLVPVDVDLLPSGDTTEAVTDTGVYHLTVKAANDPQALAVLTVSENSEKDRHIAWTTGSAIHDDSNRST